MSTTVSGLKWFIVSGAAAQWPGVDGGPSEAAAADSPTGRPGTHCVIRRIVLLEIPSGAATLTLENHDGSVTYVTMSFAAASGGPYDTDLDIKVGDGFSATGSANADFLVSYEVLG
jgi:hypothetical protein